MSLEREKIHSLSSTVFPNLHFHLSSDTRVSLYTLGKNLPQNNSIPGNPASLIPVACPRLIYLLSWGKKRRKKKETDQQLVLFLHPPSLRKDLRFRIDQLTFAINAPSQSFLLPSLKVIKNKCYF